MLLATVSQAPYCRGGVRQAIGEQDSHSFLALSCSSTRRPFVELFITSKISSALVEMQHFAFDGLASQALLEQLLLNNIEQVSLRLTDKKYGAKVIQSAISSGANVRAHIWSFTKAESFQVPAIIADVGPEAPSDFSGSSRSRSATRTRGSRVTTKRSANSYKEKEISSAGITSGNLPTRNIVYQHVSSGGGGCG